LAAHDYETMKICVDAYLRYVRGIDSTLAEIAEDVARLEARLELMGASFEAAAAGGVRDALPDGIAKAAELRDEWAGAMARHADELSEAKLLCRPVHERRHALWLHSVERLSWDETARRMGYSSAQTRRLAEIGVRELYALMPERWRREPIPNAAPR
jgi:DNA-directed RNA polymerase specialized sigma24 family protein